MAKSDRDQLYGVEGASLYCKNGIFRAPDWAEARAPQAWGKLGSIERVIYWFNDPGARDEFKSLFGGQNVTLNRRAQQLHTGNAALDILKKAS